MFCVVYKYVCKEKRLVICNHFRNLFVGIVNSSNALLTNLFAHLFRKDLIREKQFKSHTVTSQGGIDTVA